VTAIGSERPERATRRLEPRRVIQVIVSLALVAAVFFYALPKFENYSSVWKSITAMTWIELSTLASLAAWNLITYWFVMVSSLPGLNYWQAMKVNLTSTAIANTLPGGGALGIGVTTAMFSSYSFTPTEIGLSIVTTGVWNNFVKLGMPIVALALLAVAGSASGALVGAALAGLAGLIAVVFIFALVLRSDHAAERVGRVLDRVWARAARLRRKPKSSTPSRGLMRFRSDTVALLHRRWLPLTVSTVVSHVSLYLVLLVSLRHVGVSNADVSWQECLAAFSFIRLLTALPITPGGLGVVELGATAALVTAGGDRGEVVAAVLIYRALTYLPPIPLGLVAYAFWRKGAKARAERVAAQKQAVEGRLGQVKP
jgi:putative heme transporter